MGGALYQGIQGYMMNMTASGFKNLMVQSEEKVCLKTVSVQHKNNQV